MAKAKSKGDRVPGARSKKREADAEPSAILPLAQRRSSSEWHRRWFTLSRSSDDRVLGRAQEYAIRDKLQLIANRKIRTYTIEYHHGAISPFRSVRRIH
jgi:hypothetical protein